MRQQYRWLKIVLFLTAPFCQVNIQSFFAVRLLASQKSAGTPPLSRRPFQPQSRGARDESTAQPRLDFTLDGTVWVRHCLASIVCCRASCPPGAALSARISREWHRSDRASGVQVVPPTPRILLTDPWWSRGRSTVGRKGELFMLFLEISNKTLYSLIKVILNS